MSKPPSDDTNSVDPNVKADTPKEPPQTDKDKTDKEMGGRKGLDPTRYGDWEIGGKCVDF